MNDHFISFSESDDKADDIRKNDESEVKTSRHPPWMKNYNQYKKCSPLIRFHNEIIQLCQSIYPTKSELETRNKVINELESIFKSLWPTCELKVFGSQQTRILTRSSDIDISVLGVPVLLGAKSVSSNSATTNSSNNKPINNTELECLYLLANKLKEGNIVSYVEVLGNAKVPIIKFDHMKSGLSIDVCINNTTGIETGNFIVDAVLEYPALRILSIVLKTFLAQRNLNDTYSGGIGSFVLSCMVLSFLQMRRKFEAARGEILSQNLGILLIEFFSLYGGSFNLYHCGISLRDGGSYFRKRERDDGMWFNPNRPNLLAMENPFYPDQDMGKNSFNIGRVRRSFEHTHQVLVCCLSNAISSSSSISGNSNNRNNGNSGYDNNNDASSSSSFLNYIINSNHPNTIFKSPPPLTHQHTAATGITINNVEENNSKSTSNRNKQNSKSKRSRVDAGAEDSVDFNSNINTNNINNNYNNDNNSNFNSSNINNSYNNNNDDDMDAFTIDTLQIYYANANSDNNTNNNNSSTLPHTIATGTLSNELDDTVEVEDSDDTSSDVDDDNDEVDDEEDDEEEDDNDIAGYNNNSRNSSNNRHNKNKLVLGNTNKKRSFDSISLSSSKKSNNSKNSLSSNNTNTNKNNNNNNSNNNNTPSSSNVKNQNRNSDGKGGGGRGGGRVKKATRNHPHLPVIFH